MTPLGLDVAIPDHPRDTRRAAQASLGRWRAQAAALGVVFVDPGEAEATLVIREPEAFVHPNALAAALTTDGGRVLPSRPAEACAAVWEFDELAAGAGSWEPAPASLTRRQGAERVAPGFLVHSFVGRRSHARGEVAALVPRGAARILELGCAEGALGAGLEAGGARVTGIELDEAAAAVASTRLSRVFAEPLETVLPRLGERFDAAVAADVLEHLDDPIGVLRLLRDASDTLVFSVPNGSHASVLAGLLQGRWDPALEGIVAFDHRTYAGRAGWNALLRAGGWEVTTWRPVALATPRSERWRPALRLPEEELTAYQWLGVARRAEPAGPLALESASWSESEPAPNALAAAAPLFRGEVATARAALVRAVTRAGGGVPAGRVAVPGEASRARALGLPVAWADLEAERWE